MMKDNVEIIIQLKNQKTIKIVGKLYEFIYGADKSEIQLDIINSKFVEEK